METNNNDADAEMGPVCQRRRTAIPLWPQEGDELGESVEILHEIEVIMIFVQFCFGSL